MQKIVCNLIRHFGHCLLSDIHRRWSVFILHSCYCFRYAQVVVCLHSTFWLLSCFRYVQVVVCLHSTILVVSFQIHTGGSLSSFYIWLLSCFRYVRVVVCLHSTILVVSFQIHTGGRLFSFCILVIVSDTHRWWSLSSFDTCGYCLVSDTHRW